MKGQLNISLREQTWESTVLTRLRGWSTPSVSNLRTEGEESTDSTVVCLSFDP